MWHTSVDLDTVPHHAGLPALLEDTVHDLGSGDPHRLLLALDCDLKDLLHGRLTVHARLGDLG